MQKELNEALLEFKRATKNNNDVKVLNKDGVEESFCSRKRARILIERGDAVIQSHVPFTIRLLREMGETDMPVLTMTKNTVHLCLSNLGQNRTEFLLRHALNVSTQRQKVLFISSIINEKTLNSFLKDVEYPIEHFIPIVIPYSDSTILIDLIDTYHPDILVLDEWDEKSTLLEMAKEKNLSILYGLSLSKKQNRMPVISDLRGLSVHETDTSSVIGLYGNQASVLKNRYGGLFEGKAIHMQHIRYHVEKE